MKKLFFFLAAMVLSIAAQAAVITISPTSPNDADNLRKALNSAADGDTIIMETGTYVESNENYIAFDGKSVTVIAAEGAEVLLQPQVPITITNGGKATLVGIKIDASHLLDIADWYSHVIYASDATEGKALIMDGCELYNFKWNKSLIYSASGNKLALCQITNCYFHDNMKSCLFFEGESLSELSITNSTFSNVTTDVNSYYAAPIDVRNATATITIDHCTFYNCEAMNTDYGAVKVGLAAANISNSIFVVPKSQSSYRAIYAPDGSSAVAKNCLTYNYNASKNGIRSACEQIDCIVADPLFEDAANGDFSLMAGSPALTAGTDGGAIGDPNWGKKGGVSTSVNNVAMTVEAQKIIRNGQIFIVRGNEVFNALGQVVK